MRMGKEWERHEGVKGGWGRGWVNGSPLRVGGAKDPLSI